MFATRGLTRDKTCAEKIKVDSSSKRRVEDEWGMERRFITHDKIDYITPKMYFIIGTCNTNTLMNNT